MDKCGLCFKPSAQLFESPKGDISTCFKCHQLVPEVLIEENIEGSIKVEEDTSLHCDICNKDFLKNTQFQAHVRNHRAERRFVCTYCNKAFSQSNNLRAHLRIHTNERPYKCKVCGKAFTQVTNLNNHVRLHTGEKPFVCTEPGCNKAYAQVTNLNQHKKRHQNGRQLELTYDCTICGEQFEQRNHMYIHRRAAHGHLKDITMPFNCKACSFATASEKILLEHHMAEHIFKNAPLQDDLLKCVFSSCEATFSCEKQHTDHLLKSHQLRVVSAVPSTNEPPRRGRPPKNAKAPPPTFDFRHEDLIEIDINMRDPLYVPKLKVQNMFQ